MISSPKQTTKDTRGVSAEMGHVVDSGTSHKRHPHAKNLENDSQSQEGTSIAGKVFCQVLWQQPDCNFRAGRAAVSTLANMWPVR
jgi:hypothetical protein